MLSLSCGRQQPKHALTTRTTNGSPCSHLPYYATTYQEDALPQPSDDGAAQQVPSQQGAYKVAAHQQYCAGAQHCAHRQAAIPIAIMGRGRERVWWQTCG